jgi:hypothetical protein
LSEIKDPVPGRSCFGDVEIGAEERDEKSVKEPVKKFGKDF